MDTILKNIDNPQGDKLESKEVFERHTHVEEALNRSRWLCVGDDPIYSLHHPRCLDHTSGSTSQNGSVKLHNRDYHDQERPEPYTGRYGDLPARNYKWLMGRYGGKTVGGIRSAARSDEL